MVKVLLVYEDFNELVLAESFLKKVGFDIVGVSNEVLLHDQLLSFNPDVVVANGRSSRVSSFSVGQKMKENHRFQGKCVVVVPKDVRPSPQEMLKMKMDGILESPVQPDKLIQVLCRLTNQDANAFLEKFQKAKLTDPELQKNMMVTSTSSAESIAVKGNFGSNSEAAVVKSASLASQIPLRDPERIQKYTKMTAGIEFDMKQSSHTRQDIKEKQKDLKKDWDFDKLEDLDEQKREFASALFRKK